MTSSQLFHKEFKENIKNERQPRNLKLFNQQYITTYGQDEECYKEKVYITKIIHKELEEMSHEQFNSTPKGIRAKISKLPLRNRWQKNH